jgi:hypothetical protein
MLITIGCSLVTLVYITAGKAISLVAFTTVTVESFFHVSTHSILTTVSLSSLTLIPQNYCWWLYALVGTFAVDTHGIRTANTGGF